MPTIIGQPIIPPDYDSSYCTYEDVEGLIKPQIQFGSDESRGQFTEAVNMALSEHADALIDNDLSHVWVTPFRKRTVHGINGYPQPIVFAAALMVSIIALNKFMAESEPGMSDRAKDFQIKYDGLISKILSGEALLPGQRRRAKSHFVSPNIQEAQQAIPNGGPNV